MNEMLDDALIDLKPLKKGKRITRNQPRISDDNFMHQKQTEPKGLLQFSLLTI